MANPQPKNETVKVILEPGKTPPFHLQSPLLQGGRLVFENDHHPGFDVFFTIDDPDNSGYLFPKNEKKALSAKEYKEPSDGCPGQGETWSQFSPVVVSADFKTLQVRNLNTIKTPFGFSLFVTKTPETGGDYWQLDPIGDNKNGPVTMFNWTYVAIAVAGVAVIALSLYELGVFGR
jgi:hypothetical protein